MEIPRKPMTGKDYVLMGETGREKYIEDMLALEDPDDPYTEEENRELYGLQFDGFVNSGLQHSGKIDGNEFNRRQEEINRRVSEIRSGMLKRKKEQSSENYDALLHKLDEMNEEDIEEAIEVANKIKKQLIEAARGTSRGYLNAQAKRLTFIMFNKFRNKDFDKILEELSEVQQNPIILREPEELETKHGN